MHKHYRVSVEVLENGFTVEVPDLAAIAKQEKAAGRKGDVAPYMGDHYKKFQAGSVKEVLEIVKTSLSKIPEGEYDAAFDDAAEKDE